MPIFQPQPLSGTSGVDTLDAGRDLIVRRSLRMVGAYTSTDKPRPEQLQDAIFVLNLMLKAWSIEGFLWLREFVTVPLVAGQNSYLLGPNSPTPMDRPSHVFNANRKAATGNELPMTALTRSDWMAIPNKTNTSAPPVQYYYDNKTGDGVLYVWPTPPAGTTDSLVLDVDRQLDVMIDNLNTFDLPPLALECITYNLAARLAPEYGLALQERQALENEANALFVKLTNDDRDVASVHLQVWRP